MLTKALSLFGSLLISNVIFAIFYSFDLLDRHIFNTFSPFLPHFSWAKRQASSIFFRSRSLEAGSLEAFLSLPETVPCVHT